MNGGDDDEGGCGRKRESGVQEASCQTSTSSTTRPHPDEFGRAVARIAVAQICEAVEFEGVAQSALEGLSDIVVRYIKDVGKSASHYASLCGRRESNFFDVLQALEDLEGKERADVVQEIVEFVECNEEEVPFTQPIPQFPIAVSGVKRGAGVVEEEEEKEEKEKGVNLGKHIPDWLPVFPEPHTYIQTPMWNTRSMENRVDKLELVKQRRRAERSLINLQQRLLSNVLAEPSSVGHGHGYGPGPHGQVNVPNGLGAGNPPHGPPPLPLPLPLPAAEAAVVKVVSQDGEKKPLSAVEAFGPALDAIRVGGIPDLMDVDRSEFEKRKPVVKFKLRAGRKLLVEDLDVKLRTQITGKKDSWLERLDEKDDKKKRAELILRQSLEPPQEMSQM